MSGYTPVFGSLFRGSLCGQWPALPVFCTLLPLADKDGVLDYSFGYLSNVTGWPEELLREGIAQLEAEDPASRNPTEDGRRIVRLRENTEWGWRIVNHVEYREKARLMAKNAREVAEGKNASRMADRRGPPGTAADPLSNSNSNSKEKKVPTEPVERDRSTDAVETVFRHWQAIHSHPTAKLDDKRRRVIRAALSNYTADELCEAISGYRNSPHHMGQNDRNTIYDGIELLLRDAKHIDAGLKFARDPPRSLSKLTRQNISNTEAWVPPEVRSAGQ